MITCPVCLTAPEARLDVDLLSIDGVRMSTTLSEGCDCGCLIHRVDEEQFYVGRTRLDARWFFTVDREPMLMVRDDGALIQSRDDGFHVVPDEERCGVVERVVREAVASEVLSS